MHALQMRNVPDKLFERLKNESQKHHRSISHEALAILENHLFDTMSGKEDIFSTINTLREEAAQQYGIDKPCAGTIREDRQR